jgi:hypothetical protein
MAIVTGGGEVRVWEIIPRSPYPDVAAAQAIRDRIQRHQDALRLPEEKTIRPAKIAAAIFGGYFQELQAQDSAIRELQLPYSSDKSDRLFAAIQEGMTTLRKSTRRERYKNVCSG